MATPERLPPAALVPAQPMRPAFPAAEVIDAEFIEAPRGRLRDLLRIVHRYRWLAGTILGTTCALVTLATLCLPRKYTATTRLQVSRQSSIEPRLDESVLRAEANERLVNGVSSFLATQVSTLRSRDLVERVIRDHRLTENEAFLRPGSDRAGLLALSDRVGSWLRPRGWGAAPAPRAAADEAIQAPVDPLLVERYLRYLSVQDQRGTDIVEVSVTTPSPTLSAFLSAAHTQAYLDANEEARLITSVSAKDFLTAQLRESQASVERTESELGRFAEQHPEVAVNQEQKTVAQRISELSTLVTQAEGERVGLETQYGFLNRPGEDAFGYFLDRPGIQRVNLALVDVRTQIASLTERLGPNHQQMIELRRQESELLRQMKGLVGQELGSLRARLDAARLREDELRRRLAEQQEAATRLRALGTRYDMLKADVETAHALHASLLKQQMETAVKAALAASNIRVVERAEVPFRAAKPNVPVYLAFGVILGTLLSLATVMACEFLDDSVKSTAEMEDLLRLPTLATIPNFAVAREAFAGNLVGGALVPAARNGAAQLVLVHEPRSAMAEAFRGLRNAVIARGPSPAVIVVTSAGASEGKTVVSLNLAGALAEAGSRVLLVDVDLRHPGCHKALGVRSERGLATVLAGEATLADVLHEVPASRLAFIPAGTMPRNPAELVNSAQMQQAIEELRGTYDFVVLDTPPVLPVADALVLARYADGVVLVVKAQETPREVVRRAVHQLERAGARVLGPVVNNVDLGWSDYYFYGSYYGAPYEAPRAEEGHA
jgi:capsular exopolysaccharide synthesis family protein